MDVGLADATTVAARGDTVAPDAICCIIAAGVEPGAAPLGTLGLGRFVNADASPPLAVVADVGSLVGVAVDGAGVALAVAGAAERFLAAATAPGSGGAEDSDPASAAPARATKGDDVGVGAPTSDTTAGATAGAGVMVNGVGAADDGAAAAVAALDAPAAVSLAVGGVTPIGAVVGSLAAAGADAPTGATAARPPSGIKDEDGSVSPGDAADIGVAPPPAMEGGGAAGPPAATAGDEAAVDDVDAGLVAVVWAVGALDNRPVGGVDDDCEAGVVPAVADPTGPPGIKPLATRVEAATPDPTLGSGIAMSGEDEASEDEAG